MWGQGNVNTPQKLFSIYDKFQKNMAQKMCQIVFHLHKKCDISVHDIKRCHKKYAIQSQTIFHFCTKNVTYLFMTSNDVTKNMPSKAFHLW